MSVCARNGRTLLANALPPLPMFGGGGFVPSPTSSRSIARAAFAGAFAARGATVRMVDPAMYVADAIVRATTGMGSGRGRFLLSRDSDVFRAIVAREFARHERTIAALPACAPSRSPVVNRTPRIGRGTVHS